MDRTDGRTNERTKISLYWAPVGAKNFSYMSQNINQKINLINTQLTNYSLQSLINSTILKTKLCLIIKFRKLNINIFTFRNSQTASHWTRKDSSSLEVWWLSPFSIAGSKQQTDTVSENIYQWVFCDVLCVKAQFLIKTPNH